MGQAKQKDPRLLAKIAIANKDFRHALDLLRKVERAGKADADVFNDMAALCQRLGAGLEEQVVLLERAARMDPTHAKATSNLAKRLCLLGMEHAKNFRVAESLPLFERSIALVPNDWTTHMEFGKVLYQTGKLDEAIARFARAANLAPSEVAPYASLGIAFLEKGLFSEAKGAFQQVLALEPQNPVAFNGLGMLANRMAVSDVAVNMFRRVLEVSPNSVEAHNNLALVLRSQGEVELAYQHYKKAVETGVTNYDVFSGYLLTLNYMTTIGEEEVFREHRKSDSVFPVKPRALPPRDTHPERVLRVGYVSPDFRYHSVSYFIPAVLAAHNRDKVHVSCYYTGAKIDEMSNRTKAASDQFVHCFRWSDDALASRIMEDGIDILVELSGHTGDHRLSMLRNRVAPIQASYLGYPNTTGLSSMDIRITDDIADPAGRSDRFYTEKLMRIDGGFLAYEPPPFALSLEVNELPALSGKGVTFGCFNNLAKVHDGIIAIWAAILQRVPGSRLVLKAKGMRDERVRRRLFERFASGGVEPERLELNGHELFPRDHMIKYGEIDVALDTYPYAGTTTTCEALWMGVPVVTLEGERHASRVGASLLSRIGLVEAIATDAQSYVDRAAALAADLPALSALRKTLRGRMQGSPLMDAGRMARGLEQVYREGWAGYCARSGAGPAKE